MALLGTGAVVAALAVTGCAGAGSAPPTVTTEALAPQAITPAPAATVPPTLKGHVIGRVPTTRHVVVLTFDGGSGAQGAKPVLSTLSAAGVRGTFFLTGRFVQTYPTLSGRIAATHVVGNHTMTHPHLTTLTSAAIRVEISGAGGVLRPVLGQSPKPWFRFPFGEYNARTLSVVNGMGYVGIGWTVDTLGWEGRKGAGTVDDIVGRVMTKLQPGTIVLMHLGAAPDGSTLDADALPSLIAAIRNAGYGFRTVRMLTR